jgi:hypothetical protein
MLQRNKARAMRCAIAPYELQKNPSERPSPMLSSSAAAFRPFIERLSAVMRASHDLHGVFDMPPLQRFFGVALAFAIQGIPGRLGNSLKAVLLDHLPRD